MKQEFFNKIEVEKIAYSKLGEVNLETINFGKVFGDHMFVADYSQEKGWYSYKIVPFGEIKIKPSNITLNYGQSIFEGLKAYHDFEDDKNIILFRLSDNIRRMNKTAKRIAMPPIPEQLFRGGITKLLHIDSAWVPKQKKIHLYIRPLLYGTDSFIGIGVSKTYRFLIFTCLAKVFYDTPLDVKIETQYIRAGSGGTGAAKFAGNYGGSIYPRQLAIAENFHEVLWTDAAEHKYIEEAGTMNVMFVINNKLITSPLTDTILAGITRDSVLTFARDKGIVVEERPVSVQEVIEAVEKNELQEAFGTGTAVTIINLNSISYQNKIYTLPSRTPESLSSYFLKKLNNIKHGLERDSNNWIYKIKR